MKSELSSNYFLGQKLDTGSFLPESKANLAQNL